MFEWIIGVIEQWGYGGIALLMFLENVFPPIPSELIMPLAGFTAMRGDLDLILVILAALLGSLAGALFWFYVGQLVGLVRLKRWAERHGRLLTLSPEDVDQASRWFARYGGLAVFIGRLVPVVRTLISVPAGIAQMPLGRFLLFSAVGTLIWTVLLTLAGYLLGSQYERVEHVLNPVTNLVVAGVVLVYLYRVITFRRRPNEP